MQASSCLAVRAHRPEMRILAVPICAFLPYQAVVMAAGSALAIDTRVLLAIDHVCAEAFRRLFALGFIKPERPGDLSARERRVVELSASGKTASEIAAILEISQRTVHAHLQNASEKLAPTTRPIRSSRRCATGRSRSELDELAEAGNTARPLHRLPARRLRLGKSQERTCHCLNFSHAEAGAARGR